MVGELILRLGLCEKKMRVVKIVPKKEFSNDVDYCANRLGVF